jgi:hypothetical protein
MPYPKKRIFDLDERERSFAYNFLWLGLPLSILLVIGMQFEALGELEVLVGGAVSGTLIGQALVGLQDEFYRNECSFAANWALSFAGLALFAQIIPFWRDYEFDAGMCLAIMALVFHTALVYRRIRDGALAGGS